VTSPTLRTTVAGLSVAELASRFGTPLFVYDGAVIRERFAELGEFDVVRYAQKANSTLAVLALLRGEGALVDAVSAGEIERALRAGYRPGGDPPEIVYTADIFDRASLELVARHRLDVNCGSEDMVDQYADLGIGRSITLRVNPGFGHGHHHKTNTGGAHSKHGIWHENLDACVARARARGLAVSGVHVHIGSGADMAHLRRVATAVGGFARRVGADVESISAGGGLTVPYRDTDPRVEVAGYFEIWDAVRKGLARDLGHPVRLEIEPGRFLVAESGCLVTEIRARKQVAGTTFYLVDAGFNNLARPVMYGAWHAIAVAPGDGDRAPRAELDVVVGGPLCESGDIFTQREGGVVETRRLPDARVGEHLVIAGAGAYSAAMGSNYNSKPLAAEVLVEDGRARLVRARQDLGELMRGETT
jgi:diaminopimelate decarboxylase